uniref:Cysteine-rich receptor-like protein kinase 10 n=1 Tax=Aegilops tauschii TaxID=37682 RepID=N1R1N9_AEGTA
MSTLARQVGEKSHANFGFCFKEDSYMLGVFSRSRHLIIGLKWPEWYFLFLVLVFSNRAPSLREHSTFLLDSTHSMPSTQSLDWNGTLNHIFHGIKALQGVLQKTLEAGVGWKLPTTATNTTRRALLNWNRRRHIIEGVAQGLLYLHKHSRLRVIHRDLKASNILLDENMNPKISDFGLARIFGSNESHANTSRVVGTHGYMAPEYASEGQFSIKSDVFSFGVLLLEIISGKRNNGFHQTGNIGNLLGYAWLLWKREKWCELIDPCLDVKHPNMEIMRFINVGLMCVQDDAIDRPTISDAISLLMNESTSLPDPKKPAYFRNKGEDPELGEQYSVNLLTGSPPDGR